MDSSAVMNPSSTDTGATPQSNALARARLAAVAVVVIVGLSLGVGSAANRAGWVPHREDTTVYFGRADWAVGEERNCIALPESDGGVIFLGCVAGGTPELSPEVWPVTYWGQTRRPDMFEYVHLNPGMHTWNWRCRRYRNSLTCWAVN
jgi:hypothetical protein